jgi:hypothetical protein
MTIENGSLFWSHDRGRSFKSEPAELVKDATSSAEPTTRRLSACFNCRLSGCPGYPDFESHQFDLKAVGLSLLSYCAHQANSGIYQRSSPLNGCCQRN